MSNEKATIYISPEDDLTSVRERLEDIPTHYIILVIPAETQLRSHVAWKLLRARVRELGKEVQIVSDSAQVRSVASAVNFKVTSSLNTSPIDRSLPPRFLPPQYREEEPNLWSDDTDVARSIREAADSLHREPNLWSDDTDVARSIREAASGSLSDVQSKNAQLPKRDKSPSPVVEETIPELPIIELKPRRTKPHQILNAKVNDTIIASISPSNVPIHVSPKAVKIFYCYAHQDKLLRDELAKHLHPLIRKQYITEWFDREIKAGMDWQQEIKTQLDAADIILLLVSADFIFSDYCYSIEMERALTRHKAGEVHVIPVILRPAHWEETPLSELQVLPTGALPITRWPDRDEAFLNVVREIRKVIRQSLSLED